MHATPGQAYGKGLETIVEVFDRRSRRWTHVLDCSELISWSDLMVSRDGRRVIVVGIDAHPLTDGSRVLVFDLPVE